MLFSQFRLGLAQASIDFYMRVKGHSPRFYPHEELLNGSFGWKIKSISVIMRRRSSLRNQPRLICLALICIFINPLWKVKFTSIELI